jgi:hypothetical protein
VLKVRPDLDLDGVSLNFDNKMEGPVPERRIESTIDDLGRARELGRDLCSETILLSARQTSVADDSNASDVSHRAEAGVLALQLFDDRVDRLEGSRCDRDRDALERGRIRKDITNDGAYGLQSRYVACLDLAELIDVLL